MINTPFGPQISMSKCSRLVVSRVAGFPQWPSHVKSLFIIPHIRNPVTTHEKSAPLEAIGELEPAQAHPGDVLDLQWLTFGWWFASVVWGFEAVLLEGDRNNHP